MAHTPTHTHTCTHVQQRTATEQISELTETKIIPCGEAIGSCHTRACNYCPGEVLTKVLTKARGQVQGTRSAAGQGCQLRYEQSALYAYLTLLTHAGVPPAYILSTKVGAILNNTLAPRHTAHSHNGCNSYRG